MMLAGSNDETIRALLATARTIAVVGASSDPARPSHGVMRYLKAHGYRLAPVNPNLDGRTLLGRRVAADLAALRGPVDIVDIFRNSEAALEAVRAAVREKDRLAIHAIWMQIGVVNETAAKEATDAGLTVVMDRCIKIEHMRLLG